VYKPIKPLADAAAELAVAVAQGEEPPEGLINGEEDNGTEQVPTVFLETIPVFQDNVQKDIVDDGFWSAKEICTAQYAQACQQLGIQ
jgi:D-xylose transport system substrate-binding protein